MTFVVVDGGEGVGKSTQVARLVGDDNFTTGGCEPFGQPGHLR